MTLLSRYMNSYRQRRVQGGGFWNWAHAVSMAPVSAVGGGVRDRVSDSYNQNRNDGKGVIHSAATAIPIAISQKASENKLTEPFANLSSWFLIFAYIINFVLEPRYAWLRFSGFDLEYFRSTIISGNWVGIYTMFHFNIFFLVVIFTYFNLRNGKPHILRVWLSLILVLYILGTVPILNTYMGMRGIMELGLLLFTVVYLAFSKEPTWDDLFSTIVVMWVMYNLWMFGANGGGALLHFIFLIIFFISFGFSKKYREDRTQIKWWLLIIILFDFFLPSLFASLYPNLPIVASLPFLFFGVLIFAQVYEPTWLTIVLIMLFVMFYFIKLSMTTAAFQKFIGFRDINDNSIQERKDPFKVATWMEIIRKWTNQSIYYASGQDYYESQVDENAKKKLGVYLEDIDKNPKKYYDNERIILDATLTAENFKSDESEYSVNNTIKIDLSCEAFKSDKPYAKGKIYPQTYYEIENYDLENIQCIFEPWQLEKGIYEIRFNAEFNFETQAYLKRYFVSKDNIDALRRKEVIKRDEDILRLNKIDDVEPLAKNSVGPVEIKASDRIPAILKLDSNNDLKQLFAIELSNKWSGKIKQIKDIQLFLPEGIKIEEGTCRFSMKEISLPDYEQYKGYIAYGLAESKNTNLEDEEKAIKQSCGLIVKAGDGSKILQPGDVTTRYFRMISKYDYELESKLQITINEESGLNLRVLQENNNEDMSSIRCELKNDEDINDNVLFILYQNDEEKMRIPDTKFCGDKTCEYTFSLPLLEKGSKIKCEAVVGEGEEERRVTAYTSMKNIAPIIKSISMGEEKAIEKGTNAICDVEVSDPDSSNLIVKFDFEGLNLPQVQRECTGKCSIMIPTDTAKETTTLKCLATAYDGEDKSEQKTAEIMVNVPIGVEP